MYSEWTYLPAMFVQFVTNYHAVLMLIVGSVIGFVVGVIPGLGPTMAMALSLGVVGAMDQTSALAYLLGIMVTAVGSGGITASLANIPGTAAAAATSLDGYAMSKAGKGREAVGISVLASVIGSITGIIAIFIIQPFVTSIALKFGDWEVFLFCIFGLLICGSLSGDEPVKGWISAMLGLFFAMVGLDNVQSVARFTFGKSYLLPGIDSVVAMIGLFGLGEVFYVLKDKDVVKIEGKAAMPKLDLPLFARNWVNVLRSTLAGIWVGFIPGVGESAACWFSYDLAKRGSKHKEKFGKGSEEGIIAAEVANNACSVGALIPALALGVPGSSTTAIMIAAMFLMNYRPGPTLLIDSPGILCKISVIFIFSALMLLIVSWSFSKMVIKFLSIPRTILLPLVAVFCVLGSWGTAYTYFGLATLLFFGVLGMIMKLYNYPIAPMVLGLLIGDIADRAFRTTMMQYSAEPAKIFMRPFGLAVIVVLGILLYFGSKTNINSKNKENPPAKEAAHDCSDQ